MSVEDIYNLMNYIEYGFIDKNNKRRNDYDTFYDDYQLQSPEELIQSKLGVCWDQVELERYYFENNNINCNTYYIIYYDNKELPTHTFLVFNDDDNYYWFEHSWEIHKGIHKYNTLEELLSDVRYKFIEDAEDDNIPIEKVSIYEYTKPNYHLSVQEFMDYCSKGNPINIK